MPIIAARGVAKQVAIAPETNWGVEPAAGTARFLRRVTANFNLNKETYESAEIRTSQQMADMRHGTQSATGTLNGELSAGSYADIMGALVARDFAVVAPATGLSITIAASGSNWTITRSTGSWLTSGFGPGLVMRLTAGTFNAANLNKNLLILTATALALTVRVLNSTLLVAEGPIASATATVQGKTTFAPLTGHTDKSFSVEERYTDINQYELYTGMKANSMGVSIPASGLTTVDFGFSGRGLNRAATTAYFTAPTAQSNTGIVASVNGLVVQNGVPIAVITNANFNVERSTENAVVTGVDAIEAIFTGRIRASGDLSMYFVDAVARDAFRDETEVSLIFTLTEGTLATANAISFTFPRCKFGGFEKADAEQGITVSVPFQALENANTAGGLPATTVMIQDTAA
jgi:hypothetical protein